MKIEQSRIFQRSVKKLHSNQKKELDTAILEIAKNPLGGERKKGVLRDVFVHKFKIQSQLTLLAYFYPEEEKIILLSLGSHENFYRDLEKNLAG